jgi:hypothetical protein
VWPHIALLTDFLVTESIYRSKGKIYFPSEYAQGYAFLQSKVYGNDEGAFYSDKNVRLWMPAKLIRCNDIQVNYLSGYGNGNLYLALMNQSDDAIEPTISIHPDLVAVDVAKTYQVRKWDGNGNKTNMDMKEGKIKITIPAKGIISLAIDSVSVFPRFQEKFFSEKPRQLSEKSYLETDTPFGKVTGMIISMGESLSHAYFWLKADEKVLKKSTLFYKTDQDWIAVEDIRYPYEYSIPLTDSFEKIEFRLEGTTVDDRLIKTGMFSLNR